MTSAPRSHRPYAALLAHLPVLCALLGACGAPPPAPLEAPAPVDAGALADTSPLPVTPRADASATDASADAAVDAPAPTPPACDALPELADPRNTSDDGAVYELAGLVAASDARRSACIGSDWQNGTDVTVRFTPPSAGRWRLSVAGPEPIPSPMSVSIHGACADGAPGPLARCTPTATPFALTVAEGESHTLVIDGCHETMPCRFTLRAERIAASSAAPELVDLHVFRAALAVTVVGTARDADGDLSLVDVDWLDARGNVLPRTDGRPRVQAPWTAVSDRESFRFNDYDVPAQADRARVQLEDATALVSAARYVAIEDPPVRAQGETCDREGATSTCDANTRCVYDRSTGYTCKARLVAHHDADAGSLRVDLDAHDLAMAFAEVAFLDAAGAELARTERFAWAPTCCAYDVLERALLLARDGWRAPVGLARVQTAVFDRDGLRIATLDAPVEAPASRGPVVRVRRDDDRARPLRRCARVRERRRLHRQVHLPGARGGLPGRLARAKLGAARRRERTGARRRDLVGVGRLVAADVPGAPTWAPSQDVIDFVAPVAGTYRIALTAPSAPDRFDFALSARRYCGLVGPAAERACSAANARVPAPTIEVSVAAGEHVPLLVSSVSSTLNYRLEATLAPSAP